MNKNLSIVIRLLLADSVVVSVPNVINTITWYKDGFCHRLDGPAATAWDGCKYWFVEGERHREDGPAVCWSDRNYYEWWIRDRRLVDTPKWALGRRFD